MMKKYNSLLLILLGFIFHVIPTTAQNQTKLDSLQALLETNLQDTSRLHILHDLAVGYSNFDSAQTHWYYNKVKKLSDSLNETDELLYVKFRYARLLMKMRHYEQANSILIEGLKLATLTHNLNLKSIISRYLGHIHKNRGEFTQANNYYNICLDAEKKRNNFNGVTRTLRNIGALNHRQAKYNKAIDFFFKALAIDQEQSYKVGIATSYHNLGLSFNKLGRTKEALEYFTKAYQMQKERNFPQGEARLLGNIGIIYHRQGDHEKAKGYYDEALKVYKEVGDRLHQSVTYQNIGDVRMSQKKHEEASVYFLKAIEIAEELGSNNRLAYFYNSLGICYYEQNDIDQAIKYGKIALAKAKLANTKEGVPEILNQIGKAYLKQENLLLAKKHLNQSLTVAEEIKKLAGAYEGLKVLSTVEEKLGNYRQANEYLKQYYLLKDSLSNEQKTKEITRLQADFEFQQERDSVQQVQMKERITYESEIQLKERNQQFSLAGLFGALIIAIISLRFFLSKKKANTKLIALNTQILEQKEEIQLQAHELSNTNNKLKELDHFKEDMTGMLVHDLKNPLNTIVQSVKEYNPEHNLKIKQAGNQLYNMVMNILDVYKYENSQMIVEQSEVALNDIITKAIDDTSLLAHHKSIELRNNISADIRVYADREIIFRVFSNLLSNAIKYSPQNGTISISTTVNDHKVLSISITDSGKGIASKDLEHIFDKFAQVDARSSGVMRSTGLGLTFCKMAVEAHKGEISATSEIGKGTTFTFTLPLIATTPTEKITALAKEPQILITLTSEEKEILKPIVNELSQTLVFEVGEVKEILRNIDARTPNITHWKNEVNQSVSLLNEKKYQQLIRLADTIV